MWHIWRAVKELVDTVATVGLHNSAIARFGVFFYRIPWVAEEHTGLHESNRLLQAFPSSLDDTHIFRVLRCLGSYVIRLVQVAVEALVIEGHIEVENIAVNEYTLIRNTVTDYFVRGGADRFGEMDVV